MKTCEYCGGEFEPRPNETRRRRFCSAACRVDFWLSARRKPLHAVECPQCHLRFEPATSTQKFCSDKCRYAHKSKVNREYAKVAKQPVEGTCIVCGEPTSATRYRRANRYCSTACKSAQYHRRKHDYIRQGTKVRWQWKPGITLAGKVIIKKGDLATILAAGTMYEVPVRQLERL